MLFPRRIDIDPLDGSPLPISLDLIKTHCSVDGIDYDSLLPVYLFAAIRDFENITHRTVYRRGHRWVLEDFPQGACREIHLPRGKTSAVEKIEYVSGSQTITLRGPSSGSPPGTDYLEDLRGDDGGALMPPDGQPWPVANYLHPAPVTIHFEAGWSAGEVPADVVETILFGVRVSLDNKRGTVDPRALAADRNTFEAMASAYRLNRWYG